MRRIALRLLRATLAVLALAPSAGAQSLVFAPAEAPPAHLRLHPELQTAVGRPAARATHYARVDASALEAAVASAERGGRAEIALEVEPGVVVWSVAVWAERRGLGRLTWSGSVAGDPLGHVLLTVEGAAAVGRVATEGRSYEVRYGGGGRQAVFEVESGAGASCRVEEPGREELGAKVAGKRGRADLERSGHGEVFGKGRAEGGSGAGVDTVEVLVAYTSEVREGLGEEGLAALLQGVVDTANDVLIRTEVAGRIVLGYVGEVPPPDPEVVTSTWQALAYLRGWGDGILDEVYDWRTEHGGNLVTLLTGIPGACGTAYIPSAIRPLEIYKSGFNVVRYNCAQTLTNLAHEVGHNLGLRHDPYVDGRSQPHPEGHGYVDLGDGSGGAFRTVMAYTDACREAGVECPLVPYFSNPNLSLNGVPLGEGGVSNAAHALNLSFPVAAYSLSAPLGTDFQITLQEDESYQLVLDPSLRLVHVSTPEHGETRRLTHYSLEYRPTLNYYGADTFTYQVRNVFDLSATGTVYVEVESVADAPFASGLLAPVNGYSIDLNTAEAPLDVRWSELRHPDYSDGDAPLTATWKLATDASASETVRGMTVGDTTALRVPMSLLAEVVRELGVGPGRWQSLYHRVAVSDGERSTLGQARLLYVRRAVASTGEEEGEGGDEEAPPRPAELRAAYPNPVQHTFTLEVEVPDEEAGSITLYDMVGRVVYTRHTVLALGNNTLRLDLRGIPSGVYIYAVEVGEDAVFRGRVVVL